MTLHQRQLGSAKVFLLKNKLLVLIVLENTEQNKTKMWRISYKQQKFYFFEKFVI